MTVVSGLVLLAVYWFLILFIVLPIGLRTQGDEGARLVGTSAGSPVDGQMKSKLIWTTVIALVLWIISCAVILSGAITVDDFDLYSRFGPGADR